MGNEYLTYFSSIDTEQFSTIIIVSDMIKLIRHVQSTGNQFNGELFLESIKKIIKPYQTLLIPTYNWSFCHDIPFDYKNTPSAVGLLGNLALKDKDFKRTKHPIYSFAVFGKDKDMLCQLDYKRAFCKESIFGYIANTKSLQIGIGINIYTIAHYIEEAEFYDVIKYRYEKEFTNYYVDDSGDKQLKTYSMYVRDYDKHVDIDTTNLHNYILENRLVLVQTHGNIDIYIMQISDLLKVVRNDLNTTGGKLYCTYDNQKGLG